MRPVKPSINFFSLVCAIAISLLTCSTSAQTNYVIQGDQVKDPITGLTWMICTVGMTWNGTTCTGQPTTFTLKEAFQYANRAATSTQNWRLPNINELFSIADFSRIDPSINTQIFPATPKGKFWSSTPARDTFPNAITFEYWQGGSATNNANLQAKHFIRLVR